MRSLVLLLLSSLGCGVASAGNPKSKAGQVIAPTPLVAASETTTTIKGFGAWGPGQCDADGSLYYHSGFIYEDLVVLKMFREGPPVVYHPTDEKVRDESFVGFYVSSDGELWLLAAHQQELYLLEAGDDPSAFRRTKLETPAGAGPDTVREFVVSPNGTSLLSGYFDSTAPKSDRGHGYFLQYDASGNLLHTSVIRVSDSVVKLVSQTFVGASVASGSDGFNYFLTPDQIVVTLQSGEIVRRLKLHPPEIGLEPSQISASGGGLLVAFIKPTEFNDTSTEYELLNPMTGDPLRRFVPTPELGNNLACFSNEGLTFYSVNKQRYIVLATVPIK